MNHVVFMIILGICVEALLIALLQPVWSRFRVFRFYWKPMLYDEAVLDKTVEELCQHALYHGLQLVPDPVEFAFNMTESERKTHKEAMDTWFRLLVHQYARNFLGDESALKDMPRSLKAKEVVQILNQAYAADLGKPTTTH